MDNLQQLQELQGRALAAKIREMHSGQGPLIQKASQRLWDLMGESGCILEPIEDDMARRQHLAAIISENQAPECIESFFDRS